MLQTRARKRSRINSTLENKILNSSERNYRLRLRKITIEELRLIRKKRRRESSLRVILIFPLYCIGSQYNQEDLESMDMHSLNLFGVPLEETKDSSKELGSNKETQNLLKDLIDMTEQLDENIVNFNVRKSFAYYDVSIHLVYLILALLT